jgi:demethylmenaquinone methyltransferase / 2-methoxy-6-polyprenyl-1,4-benzoquinol methylase
LKWAGRVNDRGDAHRAQLFGKRLILRIEVYGFDARGSTGCNQLIDRVLCSRSIASGKDQMAVRLRCESAGDAQPEISISAEDQNPVGPLISHGYNAGLAKFILMNAPNDNRESPDTTDFGYQQVPKAEKAARVRAVFESVAGNYDLMNDLMSGGAHRIWKRFALSQTGLRPGQRALDVAGGTGDLAAGMCAQVGPQGLVVLTDINSAMLAQGRNALTDRGIVGNVRYSLANAERLPFPDASFDCVTIGFGLRNVTDKAAALRAMTRVLKPGGQLLVLEFSHPVAPGLKPIYDAYSFSILPWLGKVVAKDEASYRYLAESIRRFPDQETLLSMMRDAGLENCRCHNLSGGIVALHRGWRF